MKLLTLARDLQRRKAREKHGQFVAEGVRAVESLLQSPLGVTGVLVTDEARAEPRVEALCALATSRAVPVQPVSVAELESAADTEQPQGVLAVARIPAWPWPHVGETARFLVLDALQDPGNAGTVVRTAAALGVTATIALPGTVDLWNAKVVRSAMGALFTHPVVALSWEALQAKLDASSIACWAADMDGVPVDGLLPAELPGRLALVVSNEGAGLSPHIQRVAARRVSIPMTPGSESLNVAVATGILLYALRPTAARASGPVA